MMIVSSGQKKKERGKGGKCLCEGKSYTKGGKKERDRIEKTEEEAS